MSSIIAKGSSVETFGTYPDADFVAEEINLHQEKGSLGVSYQVKKQTDQTIWLILS